MIYSLRNKKVWPNKWNWIDHNNFVFGYSYCEYTACTQVLLNEKTKDVVCESGVFSVYRKLNDDVLNGLNYHFDCSHKIECIDNVGNGDVIRVWLAPDDPSNDDALILECIADHNGYYGHDFSFSKLNDIVDEKTIIEIDLNNKVCSSCT